MFYLINKEKGITSFGVISRLRKIFNQKKIGHTGTLDPLATGLLIIATENSTKLIPYLEKELKTYEFSFNLDGFSTTGDMEGEIIRFDKSIIEKQKGYIDKSKILNILQNKFSGKISQIPPKFSAIKIDGQRAYDLARKGMDIEIKPREIEIFDSRLIDFDFPKVTIEMTVSAGTYIRVMAEDIGKELGLNGYITYLHRTKIGNISINESKLIDEISKEDNISEKILFPDFPIIEITGEKLKDLLNGANIEISETKDGKIYFISHEDRIKSLVEIVDGKAMILRNRLD